MATFLELYQSLDDDPLKRGKQFERFTKWFLKNDPEWSTQVDQVWLWSLFLPLDNDHTKSILSIHAVELYKDHVMTQSSRLFFALWPDEETRQALVRLNESIQISQSSQANEFKWTQPHNFHVTLVFLGHVEAATVSLLKQGVTGITATPFVLTFDSLSYWSHPKVLCLTCRQPAQAIMELAAGLNAAVTGCGLQADTRPYLPHITLSRHVRYLPDIAFEPIVWRAESFCLVESCSEPDGVCYRVLQRWPFIKTPV